MLKEVCIALHSRALDKLWKFDLAQVRVQYRVIIEEFEHGWSIEILSFIFIF